MLLVSGTEPASTAASSRNHAGENIHSARQSIVVTRANGTIYEAGYGNPIAFTGKILGWITQCVLSNIREHFVSSAISSNAAGIYLTKPSSQIADFINSVEEMGNLHADWNGYDSESPNKFARDMAETILLSTAGVIIPSRVAPSAQGGVGICFYNGELYADIECLN